MREEGAWPWPRNAWYQIAWDSELGDEPLARTIMNEKVVVFRGPDGKAAVLEDRCCHRAAPLSMGNIQPTGLQCGYHGLIFDGDGKCVWIPGQDSIPPQARVKAYPTVERQEFVWVWMGEPEKADPSLIVDYPWNDDHANWPHKHGMYEVKCNYMLLIDNLMDLTHIPFIHRKTIGGGVQMEQVNANVDISRTENGVRYMRWMLNHTPPPTYKKAASWGDDVKVDRWQEFEYVAPGSVIQWSGALEVGRGAQENRDQDGGFSLRLYHGATPITEDSCYYFWTPANGYQQDDPKATEILYEEIAYTFTEDLAFLEGQQNRLSENLGAPLVDVKHDAMRVHARRAIDKILRAESGPVAAE